MARDSGEARGVQKGERDRWSVGASDKSPAITRGRSWTLLGVLVCAVLIAALLVSTVAGRSASASATEDSDSSNAGRSVASGEAKNVILLIGDGLGDSQITLARNYHLGAAGTLAMDTLPMTGAYTTYAVKEDDPRIPDYVVDSAASATAWATGQKTSNNRLSTTPGTDEPLETILELARDNGLRTGNVSTAELTDATPAALMSKVNDRACKGPEDMEDCPQYRRSEDGLGSIAEQAVEVQPDVLLGGGRSSFDQEIDGGPDAGRTVTEVAQREGYEVVYDAAGMEAVQPGGKLLGLFVEENMDLEWDGEPAEQDHDGEAQRCEEGQRPEDQPSLAAMTTKALDHFTGGQEEAGFFLQVEGASIDKEDHVSNPCQQIGETVAFDDAVGVALDYAERDPDTLVVVTGDHGHTSTIIPTKDSSYFEAVTEDYEYNPPGETMTLVTADGAEMAVSYATNIYRDEDGEIIEGEDSDDIHTHTGTQIRLAAQGPGAEEVLGTTDQTDLFYTMTNSLGLVPASSGPDAASDLPEAIEMPETGGPALLLPLVGLIVAASLGLVFIRRR